MSTTTKTPRATKPKPKTIEQHVTKGRQKLRYKHIYEFQGLKFNIDIEIDSYDFQSHAHISVWQASEMKWNRVAHIPYQQIYVIVNNTVSPYGGDPQVWHFQRDADKLKELANAIVF